MIQKLLILSSLLLLACCATSPTGRHQLLLVSEETAIAASKEAYLSTVSEMDKNGRIDNGAAVNARIRMITGRLVTEAIRMRPDTAEWEWSIIVIDDPESVNAWSMAGGRMAIYTGLLQQIKPTNDELAQIMGHEISHALARHTAEKMSLQMATSVGVAAVGVATDNDEIALTGAALAAALAVSLPNSRSAEKEADRMGIELAAKAGYDPYAAVSLWEKMGSLPGSQIPQFLSTHPNPQNRLQRLNRLAAKMMDHYQPDETHTVFLLQ